MLLQAPHLWLKHCSTLQHWWFKWTKKSWSPSLWQNLVNLDDHDYIILQLSLFQQKHHSLSTHSNSEQLPISTEILSIYITVGNVSNHTSMLLTQSKNWNILVLFILKGNKPCHILCNIALFPEFLAWNKHFQRNCTIKNCHSCSYMIMIFANYGHQESELVLL